MEIIMNGLVVRELFLERLIQRREEVLAEYPRNRKIKYCLFYGQPLQYEKKEYQIGQHIDSCFI